MKSAKECEEFLSYYWSDLNSAAGPKINDGGMSGGSEQADERPMEIAERLRKMIRFLSRMKSSKLIDHSLYLALLLPVQERYSKIVDHMNKAEGLNNNADAIIGIVSGSINESASWHTSLPTDGNIEKASIVQEIIEKAKDEDRAESRTLKYDGSVRTAKTDYPKERGIQPAKPRVSIEKFHEIEDHEIAQRKHDDVTPTCSNEMNERTEDLFLHPNAKDRSMDSFPLKRQSSFAKRGYPFSIDGPVSKQVKSSHGRLPEDEQRKQEPLDQSNPYSFQSNNRGDISYQRRPKASSIIYKKLDRRQHDENDLDDEDANEAPSLQSTSAFITARDQYTIDQRQNHGRAPGREGRSIKPCDYGQTKKSLGTRRGAASKFVPPVMNREENGEISRKRMASNGKSGSHHANNECQDDKLKNIDPKMVEMIENEIMDHGPPITWEDIAGLEFAKSTIQEIVIWPMLRPDIFTGLRGPPKGLLLFGPPGTGKTLIGKCIASQSHATFFSISASSLTSKWIGEGEKMVRALFSVARCQESAVVFIDEIDSLLSQRTDGEHEATRRIKTEFLVQLDGATTKPEERLLVVGATNRPQELDEAARRRLVKRLYIPLPDNAARRQIVSNLVKEQNCSLSDVDYSNIVQNTKGYSGADMANLCREAALGPIRTMSVKDIRYIKSDEVRPIVYKDFEMALRSIRPSVSQKDLESYITWNNLYGCGAI